MKKKHIIPLGIAAALVAGFFIHKSKSLSMPSKAKVIDDFDAKKYTGTWYEIARFDYRFEKDLEKVNATYSLKENGTVKVDNKGYDTVDKKWKQSIGEAAFIGAPNEGRLKVTFFKPFYSSYNILSVDEDYKYALVVGKSTDYLWLLSREKTMPEHIRTKYLQISEAIGCNLEKLIWVKQ